MRRFWEIVWLSCLVALPACQHPAPKPPKPLPSLMIPTHPTRSGMPRWYFKASERIVSTPKVGFDGTIYITTLDKSLTAVSSDGKLRWRFETDGLVVASPETSADSSVIYVSSTDGSLYAVSTTGRKLWSYRTQNSIESPPAVDSEGYVYVASKDMRVYSLRPGNDVSEANRLRWSKPYDGSYPFRGAKPSFFEERGMMFVGDQNGVLHVIRMTDGSPLWSDQICDRISSSTVTDTDGTTYVACQNGKLMSFKPDGARRWKKAWEFSTEKSEETQKLHPLLSSPRIGTDGTIYIGADDGWFYAIRAQNGEQIWRFQSGLYQKDNKSGEFKRQEHTEGYIQATAETNSSRDPKNRKIFFGSVNEYLTALDSEGKILWQLDLHGWVDNAPIYYGDEKRGKQTLYVSAGRYLFAVNP